MPATKKNSFSLLLSGLFSMFALHGQTPVDIAENVVKVGIKSEEAVYFGFAAGDKLIFSFEETSGKEMKEIEIIEMPSTSRFMDSKISKLENKTINVTRKAIYKFRFANSAIIPRVCRYKIQRIPASAATLNFNTTVYFDTYYDTTYTTVVESYVDKSDTIISNFQDRTIKVNSLGAPGSSKTTFNFVIPESAVAWSYYISADKGGQQVYQEAIKKLNTNSAAVVSKFPNFGPLAAEAIESPSHLTRLDTGQRINYWIVENENAELFTSGAQFRFLKKGKVVNDFARMEPGDRAYFFCLHNDSKEAPVTVTVKITAILINEKFSSRSVERMVVTPIKGMHLKN